MSPESRGGAASEYLAPAAIPSDAISVPREKPSLSTSPASAYSGAHPRETAPTDYPGGQARTVPVRPVFQRLTDIYGP